MAVSTIIEGQSWIAFDLSCLFFQDELAGPQEPPTITIPIVSYWETASDSRLAQEAYCLDRKGAGYDFETRPETGHDVEIFNSRFPSAAAQSVS
jgi:hypothetical protein